MKILFLSIFIISIFSIIISNTEDTEFVEKFKPTYINKGFGPYPPKYSKVKIHYKVSLMTGELIDSTYDRRKLFQFQLDKDEVISCLNIIIPKMRIGEKTSFICPPELAYGSTNGKVPANSYLNFDISSLSLIIVLLPKFPTNISLTAHSLLA